MGSFARSKDDPSQEEIFIEEDLLRATLPASTAEEKAIRALLAYVAYQKDLDEGRVTQTLLDYLDIKSLYQMRKADYDDAVAFLVGWSEKETQS